MSNRVEKVRQMLEEKQLDAMLVVKADNRVYISGFTGSSAFIIITPQGQHLVTDFRYVEQATAQSPTFNIIRYNYSDLNKTLNELLVKEDIKTLGFEKDYVTYDMFDQLQEHLDVKLVPVGGMVEQGRAVKDQEEIALMQKAQEIAEASFEHVLKFIKPGAKETEVAMELEFNIRRLGGEGLSFPTIAASGVRSSLPHGRASEKVLARGDFLTLDFGAKYHGYSGDMTRTVVLGEPTARQREVYDTVLKAQLASLEAARPGLLGKELDAVARDIITEAGFGEYFGHGLGHGVGRAVHEAPSVGTQGETKLIPGHVITIEPGIYIPGWGGVRIEDMILITEDGHYNFNRSSKALIVLE